MHEHEKRKSRKVASQSGLYAAASTLVKQTFRNLHEMANWDSQEDIWSLPEEDL